MVNKPATPASLAAESVYYSIRNLSILRGASLTIEAGEAVRLRGQTGAGKTTLGLILTGLLPLSDRRPDLQGLPSRWRYLYGDLRASCLELPSPAAFLPTNPFDTLIFPSVADELRSSAHSEAEILDVLAKVALPCSVLDKEIIHLSGGMLQRLALARALLVRPSLLAIDETREWLDPHGRSVLDGAIAHLRLQGSIVIELESTSAAANSSVPSLDMISGTTIQRSRRPTSPWSALKGGVSPTAAGTRTRLAAEHTSKGFRSGGTTEHILRDVSLEIKSGEWVGLVGDNGSGKSLLARIISGIETEDGGTVWIDGAPRQRTERIRRIGYVYQFCSQQLPLPTLGQCLRESLGPARRDAAMDGIRRWAPHLRPTTHVAQMTPFQQRISILHIHLQRNPSVLIVDEPSWGCDATEVRALVECMGNSDDRGTLLISHDLNLLRATCSRILRLSTGRIVDDLATNGVRHEFD